ncbi:DELLA protein GAI [Heracleum sosnowskyi]|uniref:DELLA protein GAI n=1 Tax=Heracleum sosnowskyi TaxID=360622 RepID=A0AAD8M787_9APIA|nr:DELLA protein GAI [Heracleum sosnowskyi]
MAYRFLAQALYENEQNVQMSGLDSRSSAMACYPFPYLPILNTVVSTLNPTLSDETSSNKRLKRTTSIAEFLGNTYSNFYSDDSIGSTISRTSSTSNLNCLSGIQIRDHVKTYTQRYLAAEGMEDAASSVVGSDCDGETKEDGVADGMRLVQLLVLCAEAVACRDKSHASVLLAELRANALVFGSSLQRVASCFVQGLTDRLTFVQPLGTAGLTASAMSKIDIASEKKEEALRLVYEVCPHIQFGHFVANLSILEAFEGENFVHVVDLGMSLALQHGQQWRNLIHSLANRTGQPPSFVRITGVGLCVEQFQIIGNELKTYAGSLGINLEFSAVESSLENLRPEHIKLRKNEVLAINSILQLHCVVKESRGALNAVLKIIHELSPKILALVEQDSSHNGPFFLGRFLEALHYYSAIFDSLDAMLPKYDTRRAKIEQFYFAEEIKNIVSCEGPARVERHERVDQWRRRMSRAGFQPAPVKIIAQAKDWLGKHKFCEGYTIVEEKGCLVLGWKSKPIVAASCWKC